jgi:hypothetical protein
MSSRIQVRENSLQRLAHIIRAQNVIQRVKICRNQINRLRQSQITHVLSQQHHICSPTVSPRNPQHRL